MSCIATIVPVLHFLDHFVLHFCRRRAAKSRKGGEVIDKVKDEVGEPRLLWNKLYDSLRR